MKKITICLLLSSILMALSFAQLFAQDVPKAFQKTKLSAENKEKAILALKDLGKDSQGLNVVENRIAMSVEVANLLWDFDEKEARTIIQDAMNALRQAVFQADSKANELQLAKDAPDSYDTPSFIFGGDSQERKSREMMMLRRNVLNSLANHDGQMAYDFLLETQESVTNEELKKQIVSSDGNLAAEIANKLVENNVTLSLEIAKKELSKGFSWQLPGLLDKIYAKDADKGASFANDIVQKLKGAKLSVEREALSMAISLLKRGVNSPAKGKKALLGDDDLRALAEIIVQASTEVKTTTGDEGSFYQYREVANEIKRFAPGKSAAFNRRIGIKPEAEIPALAKFRANAEIRAKAVTVRRSGDSATVANVVRDDISNSNPDQSEELIKILATGKLPAEQKEKMVAEAKKEIKKSRSNQEKLSKYAVFAILLAGAGEKETALEFLDEARSLTKPQPRNWQDFLGNLFLISGYSYVDPDKSFVIFEDTISQFNEVATAATRTAEFVIGSEVIENGELKFYLISEALGQDVTRSLNFNGLGVDSTLLNLANADFDRAQHLADKFDRPELRLIGKLLFLRIVMKAGTEKPVAEKVTDTGLDDYDDEPPPVAPRPTPTPRKP